MTENRHLCAIFYEGGSKIDEIASYWFNRQKAEKEAQRMRDEDYIECRVREIDVEDAE